MRLRIETSDARLRGALSLLLADAPGDEAAGTVVVITAVGDCPSDRCAALAAGGARVIILAPMPRPADRASYRAAGAWAYLPMAIDAQGLQQAVYAALTVPPGQPPPQAASASF